MCVPNIVHTPWFDTSTPICTMNEAATSAQKLVTWEFKLNPTETDNK